MGVGTPIHEPALVFQAHTARGQGGFFLLQIHEGVVGVLPAELVPVLLLGLGVGGALGVLGGGGVGRHGHRGRRLVQLLQGVVLADVIQVARFLASLAADARLPPRVLPSHRRGVVVQLRGAAAAEVAPGAVLPLHVGQVLLPRRRDPADHAVFVPGPVFEVRPVGTGPASADRVAPLLVDVGQVHVLPVGRVLLGAELVQVEVP